MIVPDINLLLYAVFGTFPEHPRARAWFEGALNGREELGLTAPAVFGFLRVATHARAFDTPLTVERALEHVESWTSRPNVRFLSPGRRHFEIAFSLLRQVGTGGNLTSDVQLAAYAMEQQATLVSSDSDFARFQGLDWVNPLQGRRG